MTESPWKSLSPSPSKPRTHACQWVVTRTLADGSIGEAHCGVCGEAVQGRVPMRHGDTIRWAFSGNRVFNTGSSDHPSKDA